MDLAYLGLILFVAAAFLVPGAVIVLLTKRAFRGVDARDPAVSDFVFALLFAISLLQAVVRTFDGDFIWQGALHVVMTFLALLWWRQTRRATRRERRH